MGLDTRLTGIMKEYILATGHNDTGSLLNSIHFSLKKTDEGFSLDFTANEYIIYLDDGKFLEGFLELGPVQSAIADAISDAVLAEFD